MYVPMLPAIGDYRDALLVVTRQRADDLRLPCRIEPYSLPNAVIEHLRVRLHLPQEAQACHDLVVQLNQFFF